MSNQALEQCIAKDGLHLPVDGLAEARSRAAARLRDIGLPNTKMENWKYTSVYAIAQSEFSEAESTSSKPVFDALVDQVSARLVFVDGELDHRRSTMEELPEGLTIRNLALAELAENAAVRASWSHDFSGLDEGFALLNTALCNQGVLIEVAAGKEISLPLEIIYVSTRSRATHPRQIIKLEPDARLDLVESYQGATGFGALCNLYTCIDLQARARLTHVSLQSTNVDSYLISRTDVEQGANSHYDATCLDLGARISRRDVNVDLLGDGAQTALYGSYALNGKQHVDNHSCIRHVATNCTSVEVFRGVLGGKSKSVFNGKVIVETGADGSDAKQSNANLLLSRDAEAFSKPELQIHADEVTAAHGSTVGELDDQALFYLRTRGIDVNQARLMLTEAFCKQVLEHIQPPVLAKKLSGLLSEALNHA